MTDLRDALDIARQVAGEAADLIRGAEDDVGHIRFKSNPRDLVTEWDTRAEDLIRGRLEALAPSIPILGEEGGASGDTSTSDRWLVDPIDGTVNFSHGLPLFATSIALERDGEPVVGAVVAPALDWSFYAASGHGAFLGDRRLRVSSIDELSKSILATGFAYDRATSRHNFAEWEHFQCRAGACRRLGAASLDLCMVGRGLLDGFWETRLHAWDLAAGAVIVREAGGTVTGITGDHFAAEGGHAIATNGAIHSQVLAELVAVGGVIHDVR